MRTRRSSKRINAPSRAGIGARRERSSNLQFVTGSQSVQGTGNQVLSDEEPEPEEIAPAEANNSDYAVSLQGNVERYLSFRGDPMRTNGFQLRISNRWPY